MANETTLPVAASFARQEWQDALESRDVWDNEQVTIDADRWCVDVSIGEVSASFSVEEDEFGNKQVPYDGLLTYEEINSQYNQHFLCADIDCQATDTLYDRMNDILMDKFGYRHPTDGLKTDPSFEDF